MHATSYLLGREMPLASEQIPLMLQTHKPKKLISKQGNVTVVSVAQTRLQNLWVEVRDSWCLEKETFFYQSSLLWGFPSASVVKNPPANAGDMGSIPGLRRPPGVGNANPLQYSCLGNPVDREAWRTKVHGVTKSQT